MTDTITLPTYMVTRAIKALNDKDNIYYGEKEVVSRMLEKALQQDNATDRDVQMTECTTYALQQALKALSLLEYRADGNVHFFPIQEQVDEAITSINKALDQSIS